MTEPNYRDRNTMADAKLQDAARELEEALKADLPHPASVHVLTALRHVGEAQSYLRGG